MKKVALVTGASRGLGLAVSNDLAKEGICVVLVGRDEANLNLAKETLYEKERHHVIALDLTKEDSVESLQSLLNEKQVSPNIIVHNLGGRIEGDSHPLEKTILQKTMRLNLEVAIEINNTFIPVMIKNGSGRIIHIGSDAGVTGNASPGYAAVKAALNGYVKSAARFYAPNNIMICGVLPGIMDHPGSDWDKKKKYNPERYKEALAKMPSKRFAKPEEISPYVIALCKDKGMVPAGSLIILNGGV